MDLALSERVQAYIDNVEQFLSKVKLEALDESQRRVLELAQAYLSDAKYYYEIGDYVTSLSCIAYAEGLLDSLRIMGFLGGVDWKPLSELLGRPRVLVAGSFEFLHPGHLALLREAWKLGRVYVIVSRDVNFSKFKGREPALSEKDRLEVVASVKYVTKAVLGDEEDFLKPIEELRPDIILLGPDQWIEPENLEKKLRERGITNVRVIKLEKRVGPWSSSYIWNRIKSDLQSSRKL